jgi:2',3'-cyclic-nucleotide 2'-phosphodiesterase (5'-nucleotidase family)
VKNVAAGKITYGDIVAMLPYENSMSVIEVTGQQLLDMLVKCTQKTPKNDWQFPQVSGMRFTVHTATHSVSDVEILDKAKNAYLPLDLQRTYSVALSSYYRGGGFYNMLKDCPVKRATTLMVRDVVIDYMSKTLGGTLGDTYRKPQGRITIVE